MWGISIPRSVALRSGLQLAAREGAFLEGGNEGYPLLRVEDYPTSTRQSRTFFILGSGASVNDLTAAQWAEVEAGYSVGLNSWAFHRFIPNLYAIENPREPHLRTQAESISVGLGRVQVIASCPQVLMFRNRSTTSLGPRISIPHELAESVRIYGRVQFPAVSRRNLEPLLRAFLARESRSPTSPALLLDNGSTIVRMIHFALRAGYSRVVLLGVDLGSRGYFFDEEPDTTLEMGISVPDMKVPIGHHGTLSAKSRTAGFVDFVSALSEAALRVMGVEVLVGSDSTLWKQSIKRHVWS